MARTNIIGFEGGTDTLRKEFGASTCTIVTSPKRSGDYALRINTTTGFATIFLKQEGDPALVGTGYASGWVRVYFRYATKPSSGTAHVFGLCSDGQSQSGIIVTIDTNGKLSITGASGSAGPGSTTLAQDTWYRLDLNYNVSDTGSYTLKIDGTTELSGTIDQKVSTTTLFHKCILGSNNVAAGSAIDFYYDDFSADDSSECGAGIILRLDPDANGNYTGFVAGTGSGGFGEVDEVPVDDDTTYVTTSTNTTQESSQCETMANAGASNIASIPAVKTLILARDESQTVSWRAGMRSSSTDVYGAASDNATASYTGHSHLRTTDPATSAAWTESGVNAAEPIVQHQQSQSRPLRCSAMYLMVEYVETGTTPLTKDLSDDLNSWADATATHVPAIGPAESLTLTDAFAALASNFKELSDSFTLSDAFAFVINETVAFEDSFTLTDSDAGLLLGIAFTLEDTLEQSDSTMIGYGAIIDETLILVDVTEGGYGIIVNESMELTDAFAAAIGILAALEDSFTLTDANAFELGHRSSLEDSFTLSDATAVGHGCSISESLTLVDAPAVGYGVIVDEAMTLVDHAGTGIGCELSETLTLTDATAVGHGAVINESLTLSDETRIGNGVIVSDSFTLTDAFAFDLVVAGGGTELTLSRSDEFTLTEQMVASSADFASLADSFTLTDGLQAQSADAASLSDDLTLTDTVALRLGYTIALSDTLSQSDAINLILGQQAALSDALSLSDTPAFRLNYLSGLSDALAHSDSVSCGYGIAITDSCGLSDAFNHSLGFVGDNVELSDSLSQSDTIAFLSVGVISFSDTVGGQVDALSVSHGVSIAEVLSQTDTWARFVWTVGSQSDERTYVVPSADRILDVPAVTRIYVVPVADRRMEVPVAPRIYVVPAADRTMEAEA